MAFVDPRILAVTPKPYAGVVPPSPATPIAVPPAPVANPNPNYKQFVQTHGGTSTAALAASWQNRFGTPKATITATHDTQPAATPPPAAPAPYVPPNPASAPQSDLYAGVNNIPGTPTIDTSALNSLPMPSQFPTLDVNKMYDPAQRSIDQRTAALNASRARAQSDNDAFAAYINGLTSKAATGLGTTMTQLGNQANAARQQSIDATVGSILGSGPGAGNADLMDMSGGAAQAASDAAMQAGQGAQNMLPGLDAQAQLQRVGLDQGAVDKASDRLMQLDTGRGANAALQNQKAATDLSKYSATLGYMTDAAKAREAAAEAQAKLGSTTQTNMAKVLQAGVTATGRMNVAQIQQYVKAQVAAGTINQAQAHDLSQQLIGIRNNKASVLSASLRATASGTPKPGTIAAKGSNALASFNSNQDTLAGSYNSLSTQAKGQRAQNGAATVAAAYPQMSWATAGPILAAAYPDRMKDPNYVAFAQKLFTGTQ